MERGGLRSNREREKEEQCSRERNGKEGEERLLVCLEDDWLYLKGVRVRESKMRRKEISDFCCGSSWLLVQRGKRELKVG